jgi:hypothetical protein
VSWDNSGGGFHHNGYFAWAVAGGATCTSQLSNVTYANNRLGPNFGAHASSGLFVQGMVADLLAYNNTSSATQNATDNPADGVIYIDPGYISGTYNVYNNTFIGPGATGSITAINFSTNPQYGASGSFTQTLNHKNNLYSGFGYNLAVYNYGEYSTTVVNSNNNAYPSYNVSYGFSQSTTGSSHQLTLAQWQGGSYNQDSAAITSAPLLNSANTPSISSPVRAAGVAISTITVDASGHARPTTPAIGAFEAYATGLSSRGTGIAVITSGP